MDQDKRNGVAAALGAPDFLLVEGPPGTGKTTFIAETVAQFLAANPSSKALIVSQTHVAVDNAIERLQSTVGDGVVRLGRADDPRLSEAVQPLLLDQQMVRWANAVRTKAKAHLRNLATRYSVSEAVLKLALDLQRLETLLQQIQEIDRAPNRAGLLSADDRTLTGVSQLADRVATQDRLEWLEEQSEALRSAIRSQADPFFTFDDIETPEDVRSAIRNLLRQTKLPTGVLRVLRIQGEWLQRVESDSDLAAAFLKTAKVVAGTCVGFLSHPAVRDLEFDLCILDEASKATATEALVPLARSKRWILVGDTRQLPPMDEAILREADLMSRHHLEPQFVETTLFDRLVAGTHVNVRHHLGQQYRMIRPIGDLISTCFYDGLLRSPISAGLPGFDRLAKPVVWLDTSRSGASRFEEATGGPSHMNRLEARITADRLKIFDSAISHGMLHPPVSGRLSVLIMSPYSRQIEELERETARINTVNLDIIVKSVDAVQGRESDLAIFCVTRNNLQGSLGFLAQPYWRRINVALSRARFGLTIIGDAQFCRAQPGALRDVLQYMEGHALDCEIRTVDNDRS